MTGSLTYTDLLEEMIAIPALSRQEGKRADFIAGYVASKGWPHKRLKNNLLISSTGDFHRARLLLNSHIDTVSPAGGWITDPFQPVRSNGRITGLGTNDAGASVVCLLAAFDKIISRESSPELALLLSAEEEISGSDGTECALKEFPGLELAIVGEPTGMQPAVAERGLMVIDALASGEAGHAARGEGVNAIYIAAGDIHAIREMTFDRTSNWLSPPGVSVTMITAGKNHNVVPDRCAFVIDARSNDIYNNEMLLDRLGKICKSELSPRSMRLNASALPPDHFAFRIFDQMGMKPFGSRALSDMALMPVPAIKIGPGNPLRSHAANEHILLSELEHAVETYVDLILHLQKEMQ